MSEYIPREAAIEAMYKDAEAHPDHTFWTSQHEALMDIPAADVRPVVLCEDCYYADYSGMGNGTVWCYELEHAMQETDFCSRGKMEESLSP